VLKFTVTSDQLAEEDIYAIQPISSLAEFLHPRRSLCIVKAPYGGKIPEMLRVEGTDRNGKTVTLYVGESPEYDHGYVKCQLDKYLHSSFLFIPWKKRGCHIFRLIEERGVKAEFPALAPALAAYLPDGFTPERFFRRKHSVFVLMLLAHQRRKLFTDLVTLLARWTDRRRNA